MSRFELSINDEALAAAYYRVEDGVLILTHTEVPFEHSGEGYATKLADGIFAVLHASGRRVLPQCEFMARYVAKHPEYAGVIAR